MESGGQLARLPDCSSCSSKKVRRSFYTNFHKVKIWGYNSQTVNAEAWLIFGNAGDVFFYPNEGGYPNMGFADFAIHPPNIQEPDVQIWTAAYPATSALVDCMVDGWNTGAPPVFEFDQGASELGPWTSTSIVTPSAGHVFYGFSIPPLDSFGVESTVIIRLEPTPDSPNIVWRFWGCELTYISQ
jgi:hypothetical protein